MKKLLFFSVTIFVILFSACSKKTAGGGSGNATVYKGVVRINMCGQIAIETVGPDYLGETSWSPGAGTTTYHHIFSVQNPCQFGTHGTGDTINFKVVGAQEQKCAQCMAYTETPATKYAVQVVD